MKEIKLTKGQVTLVDDEDFDELSKYKWHALYDSKGGRFYAVRTVNLAGGKRKEERIHRVVMRLIDPSIHVDHKNHDTLDNRKDNLRLATVQQNARNRQIRTDNLTGFKGVYWSKHSKKWQVKIHCNGRGMHLGVYDFLLEAALAYDAAARKYFGEFAYLNFPEANTFAISRFGELSKAKRRA